MRAQPVPAAAFLAVALLELRARSCYLGVASKSAFFLPPAVRALSVGAGPAPPNRRRGSGPVKMR